MSINRGPLESYEVIWKSGHVETIRAHQVITPPLPNLFGPPEKNPKWLFHSEVDGNWALVLAAPADDILSVRNVTRTRDADDANPAEAQQ